MNSFKIFTLDENENEDNCYCYSKYICDKEKYDEFKRQYPEEEINIPKFNCECKVGNINNSFSITNYKNNNEDYF